MYVLYLEKKINPEYVAESFLYTSNITSGLIESYQNLVDHLLKNYEINSVLDIGFNDGSFLEIFSKKGKLNLLFKWGHAQNTERLNHHKKKILIASQYLVMQEPKIIQQIL